MWGELEGTARWHAYRRGVSLIKLSAEARADLELRVDCEVGLSIERTGSVPNLNFEPKVHQVAWHVHTFELDRVGRLRGDVASQIGRGLRRTVERRLEGEDLAAQLNRSIAKRRDRWQLRSDQLPVPWSGLVSVPTASPPRISAAAR